jgi:hypothetical protein
MLGKEGPDRAACLLPCRTEQTVRSSATASEGRRGEHAEKEKKKRKMTAKKNTGTPQDSAFKITPPGVEEKEETILAYSINTTREGKKERKKEST